MSKKFNKNIQYTFNPQITLPTSSVLTITGNSNTIGNIFTTGGNVGIGTTSPSTNLEISSSGVTKLKIQGDSLNNAAFDDGRTQCQLQFRTEGGFDNGFDLNTQNWAGSSSFMINEVRGSSGSINTFTRLCIDTSGNVGIGTSVPAYSLQVDGDVALNILPGIGATGSIKIGRQDFNARWHMINCNTGTAASLSNMIFNLHDAITSTTVAPVLTLRGDGNVGIGTTAPSTLLHLRDNGSVTLLIEADADNVTETDVVNIKLRQDGGGQGMDIGIDSVNQSYIDFGTGNAGVGTNGFHIRCSTGSMLMITTSGNVGIGTTAPAYELDVNGSFRFNTSGNYLIGNSTGSVSLALQGALGSITSIFGHSDGKSYIQYNNDLNFSRMGGITPVIYIQATSGNVGVGTSAPTQKLDVFGNIALTNFGFAYFGNATTGNARLNIRDHGGNAISFYYAFTQVGGITCSASTTAYNTSSDYRIKENVVDIQNASNRVKQLRTRRFNFIGHPEKTVDGFLAHEASEVVPEAVHGEKDAVDSDGNPILQQIDQSKLVPLLAGALKEAILKIESLEQFIQSKFPGEYN